MSKILELARKIKALAEQGVGGEKINAKKILTDLCEKHGIKIGDLESDQQQAASFIGTQYTHQILVNTIALVCGNEREKYIWKNKPYGVIVNVTEAERLEIEMYFSIYRQAFEATLTDLQVAFIMKNDIYPKDVEPILLAPEEDGEHCRISALADGLQRTNVHKTLAPGNNG